MPTVPRSTGLFLRFATLSGLGWLLDAGLLLALVASAHWPAFAANVVSSCTAATTVFLLSRETVFRKAPRAAGRRVAAYVAYSLGVICVASAVLEGLVRALSAPDATLLAGWSAAGVAALAKAIVTPPQLLLNFAVSRFLSERALAGRRPAHTGFEGGDGVARGMAIAALHQPPAMPDRILVFIPCYQCAPQIGRVLAQFAALPPGTFAEILVVDNGSADGTVAAAVQAMRQVGCCPVSVVRNRANVNLGGSHKAAFAHARRHGHSHVLVLHGDDQGSIADILPVLRRGDHRRHDACLGARFMPGSRLQGYSRFRVFGNRVFNALFSAVAGWPVRDLGSGLNVFAAGIFDDPAVDRYADDLRFNVYLLLDAIDRRKRVIFFPISWREDDQVSNVRMASQARKTLAIAAQFLLRRAAFRTQDHRAVAHADYRFDVVASHRPADAAAAAAVQPQ